MKSLLNIQNSLILAASLAGLAWQSPAAIPVGTVQTFGTLPPVADWATFNITGAGNTYLNAAAMDAAVQLQTAAGIATALGTDTAATPGTANIARWNSTLLALQTRPTGNAATLLKATIQNTSASSLDAVRVSYSQALFSATALEEPGYRVFYSLTGAANSWVLVPELSSTEAVGTLTALLTFATPLAPGATFYMLWADDNADTASDPSYPIDNFLVEDPSVRPIQITQQPVGTNVIKFRPFSLSVQVTGTAPQYQWYRTNIGGVILLTGETNRIYSVASAQLTDTDDYYVIVQNSSNSVQSATVHVEVLDDNISPTVVRVSASPSMNRFVIEYSEPMQTDSTILDAANYWTDPPLNLYPVGLTNNGLALIMDSDAQAPNTVYQLDISSGYDLAGNLVIATNVQVRSCVVNLLGGLLFEVFGNTGASTAVSALTSHPSFPDRPTQAFTLANFDTRGVYPDDTHDNYGGRIRGVFVPPYSGRWNLFLRSDNASVLYFNPAGADAAGKVQAAVETGCCNAFMEPGATQTSAGYDLLAGQGYYIEALYKEEGGGDFCQVAARHQNDPTPAASLLPLTNAPSGSPGVPLGIAGVLSLSQHPVPATVEMPASATFSVLASSTLGAPILHQWQRNDAAAPGTFTNIPNANGRFLDLIAPTVADDNGAQFRCVVTTAEAILTSNPATLTVNPDTTGPALVSAQRDANLTTILVTFTEAVDPAVAGDVVSYTVCNAYDVNDCLNITSLVLTNNNTQAFVETSLPTGTTIYRLTAVDDVTDVLGNRLRDPKVVVVSMPLSFQQGDASGYSGTVDTHVRQDNPATSYGTSATVLGDNLSPLSHGLLRFDNIFGSGPGQIPPGSPILSASLYLRTDNWGNDNRVHRVLVPWSGASTWNDVGSANDGVSLAAGDAVATEEATLAAIAVGVTTNINVTTSVQVWATNGAPNYGWVFIDSGDDGYQFNSSEATDVTYRPRLVVFVTPYAGTNPVVIVTQPAATNIINERQSATLTVGATGTSLSFQWYRDDAAILGANGASLTINNAVPADSGRYHCTISNLVNVLQTSNSWLIVVPDTTAPAALSAAGGRAASTNIVVTFSEALNQASAETAANYEVLGPGGLLVEGAVLQGSTVTLNLSGTRTPGANYQLRVKDVTDTAVTPNVLAPNPTTLPVVATIELIAINTHPWKYLQQTTVTDPAPCLDGLPWTAPAPLFDDSAWPSGLGVFFGHRTNSVNQPAPNPAALPLVLNGSDVNTILNMFTNAADGLQETNYYFRTTFNLPTATNTVTLLVHSMIDDGAVLWLNGQRALNVRLTNDPVSCTTLANAGGGQTWAPALANRGTVIAMDGLLSGPNTLAVQVHQNSVTSSDITFGLLLEAEVVTFGAAAPRLVWSHDPATGMLTFTWTDPGVVLKGAPSLAGPWTVVGTGTSPQSVSTASGMMFFQLRAP